MDREKLTEKICEACRTGYSVMEITRIMGSHKPAYVYDVLRDRGLIKPLSRGRTKKIPVNPTVTSILKKKELSLTKWANMWGFCPHEAADSLSPPVPGNGKSSQIHVAFFRDFPDDYESFYQSVQPVRVIRRPSIETYLKAEHLALTLTYCPELTKYRAVVTNGGPDLEGLGESWSLAVMDLQHALWIHNSIERLNHILAKYPTRDSYGS